MYPCKKTNFRLFKFDDNQSGRERTDRFLSSSLSYGTAFNDNSFLVFGLSSYIDREISFSEYREQDGTLSTVKNSNHQNDFGLNLGLEKFRRLSENLYLVVNVEGRFAFGKTQYKTEYLDFPRNSTRELKQTVYMLSLNPRLQYLINNKWSLTGSFGSIYFSGSIIKQEETSDKSKTNQFGSNFGFNTFGLGIRYYLNNFTE